MTVLYWQHNLISLAQARQLKCPVQHHFFPFFLLFFLPPPYFVEVSVC
jgi:hypothetical protein